MRYSDPDQPRSQLDVVTTDEERLRRENQDLKRQIQELKGPERDSLHGGLPSRVWRPSGLTIAVILLAVTVFLAVAFVAGYVPRQRRISQITSEAQENAEALPRVEVMEVRRSAGGNGLQLPGNLQAVAEAPVLARADGYLSRRLVDIGDRVRAGQPLAEIDAPELDAQVRQSKAVVQQTQAAMEQALANLEQGRSDMELARLTAERWAKLTTEGVASRQENDQYQAQLRSRLANVQALEKGILFQRSSIAVAEANVNRLERMQSYRVVRAPFDGVITLRNVDAGALVVSGNTLLFRIAQTGSLRAYVSVPQTHSSSIRTGQAAKLSVANLPGRQFAGTVTRSANSLDPSSRTLLVEIDVPNRDNLLVPGMYAQVDLTDAQTSAPILIPSDALIIRADGAQVAVVRPDHTLHIQKIGVGRDYGDRLEVSSGLQGGETIIANPGDVTHEGLKVEPIPLTEKPGAEPATAGPRK